MSKLASGGRTDGVVDDHLSDSVIAILPTADGNFRYFSAADREQLLEALAEAVTTSPPANLM